MVELVGPRKPRQFWSACTRNTEREIGMLLQMHELSQAFCRPGDVPGWRELLNGRSLSYNE